jgi:NAD(P)H-hydrate repair Nnr-like enzyme with NAD(P)H-hydrate epimerase domain
MYILSVSEMRALESTANIAGHSYAQMMELAGQGLALAIHRRVTVKGRRVLILVGPGNNGGDGWWLRAYSKRQGQPSRPISRNRAMQPKTRSTARRRNAA